MWIFQFPSVINIQLYSIVVGEAIFFNINLFKIYWLLFCGLPCCLPWRIFHERMRRNWILLLVDFYIYIPVKSIGLIGFTSSLILVDFLLRCCIYYWEWGIDVFNYDMELNNFSSQFCHSLCHIFEDLLFSINMYRIVISSWHIINI